jgi:hypothetical protein
MGKKKGIQILSGSLKTHWMKYITEVNLDINPADRTGMSTGNAMVLTIHNIKS